MTRYAACALGVLAWACALGAHGEPGAKRFFAPEDEIGLTLFDPLREAPIQLSPNGEYVAVWSQRGVLDRNVVENTIRFYSTKRVLQYLRSPDVDGEAPTERVLTRAADKGPVIHEWRWLQDSSGVAFLEGLPRGCKRLQVYELDADRTELLSEPADCITAHDVRDRKHFVYSAVLERPSAGNLSEAQPAVTVGTGRSLFDLLLPNDERYRPNPATGLWAVIDGRRFPVSREGQPIVRASEGTTGNGELILSPNGEELLTALPVEKVSATWERLYPPPIARAPYRLRTGEQGAEFVRIDLKSGAVRSVVGAPTAEAGGWWLNGDNTVARASWSADGKSIVLPATYVPSSNGLPSAPCVAVVEVSTGQASCVVRFETAGAPSSSETPQRVLGASFKSSDTIEVTFGDLDQRHERVSYRRADRKKWSVVAVGKPGGAAIRRGALALTVRQGLNEPPRLFASARGRTRVIWDPNPQLKDIELGEARILTWTDKGGRSWIGGLYVPERKHGTRGLPLVIQTHGFNSDAFAPSGWYPTAFAARSLQAAGILVLQVREDCVMSRPDEADCALAAYASAVDELVKRDLIDPARIGIIGFSRTCYYVMEALTRHAVPIAAASITDGLMLTYFQYMAGEGLFGDGIAAGSDAVIGASPFGRGLEQWMARSPGFRLDQINAPLMVSATGPGSLLTMWEPYAGLRYLKRPVDLLMLNTDEHVLTNPAVRLASQESSVDWFRFWLRNEKDPAAGKEAQYRRWELLRGVDAL